MSHPHSSASSVVSSDKSSSTTATSVSSLSVLVLIDLEDWMNEEYLYRTIEIMGWNKGSQSATDEKSAPVRIVVKLVGGGLGDLRAYLIFESHAAAQSILDGFRKSQTGLQMPGSERKIKLEWPTSLPSEVPASIDSAEDYSVFVADLAPTTTEDDLLNAFRPIFSSTKDARIMHDPFTGRSLGYGVVRLAEPRDLVRASSISRSDIGGLLIGGRIVKISPSTSSSASPAVKQTVVSQPPVSQTAATPLWLPSVAQRVQPTPHPGHLDWLAASQPTALPYYTPVSPTNGAFPLSPRRASGSFSSQLGAYQDSRYDSRWDTERTMECLPTQPQLGNTALYRSLDPHNTTIFVGSVPFYMTEHMLRVHFEKFGEIIYISVPERKGCAFVSYARREDAERAMLEMHGFKLGPRIRLRVSWGRKQLPDRHYEMNRLASSLGAPVDSVADVFADAGPETIRRVSSGLASIGLESPRKVSFSDESSSPLSARFSSLHSGSAVSVRADVPFPGTMDAGSHSMRHTASAPLLANSQGALSSQLWGTQGSSRQRLSSTMTLDSIISEEEEHFFAPRSRSVHKQAAPVGWTAASSPSLHRSLSSPAHLSLADMARADEDGDFGMSSLAMSGDHELFVRSLVSDD